MGTDSPFSKNLGQLDQIPEDRPVVFISYSWDSEEHKQWVASLSRDLRDKGIYTLLDQYNRGGEDLISFMNIGLQRSSRVLIIGTPEYKMKINKTSGGAKYEDQLITVELYHNIMSSKFVPILRKGSFADSFSDFMGVRTGYDMSDDAKYDEELDKLVRDLWGNKVAPTLGPKPNFTTVSQVSKPLIATSQDFASEVICCLQDPSNIIRLTQMIEDESNLALKKIQKYASYNHQTTSGTFSQYLKIHKEAINNLIKVILPMVRFGDLNKQKLLINAMVKLCKRSYTNGENSNSDTQYVHLLASTFLYHTMGVAAVIYNKFELIKSLFEAEVPCPNIYSVDKYYPLECFAGYNHWDNDLLNNYLGTQWCFPYTRMIMKTVKEYFDDTFDDNEFQTCFYAWEHLASLLCNYYKYGCKLVNWFPIGEFAMNRYSPSENNEDNFYTKFFEKADSEKDNWEPIKQGLFGGKYNIYKVIFGNGEEFYKKRIIY